MIAASTDPARSFAAALASVLSSETGEEVTEPSDFRAASAAIPHGTVWPHCNHFVPLLRSVILVILEDFGTASTT